MIRTDFHESGVCVIAPESARLTAAVAGTFRDEATRIIESGHSRLVIDLSDVSFVDSLGLGALVALLKRVGNRGEIVVCGVGEAVGQMFRITRMERVFQSFPGPREAVLHLAQ